MKVKLLTSRAGVGFSQDVNDEVEVDEAEATRMINAKQAVPVRASKPEKAVSKRKAEKAAK